MGLLVLVFVLTCFPVSVSGESEKISSSYEERLLSLERRDERLNAIIEDQKLAIYRLQKMHDRLVLDNDDLQRRLDTIEQKERSPKTYKTEVYQKQNRRFVLTGEETVAFHAVFAEDSILHHLSVGSTIPFTTVKLNIGAGYHPSTSLFIAPMAGIYIFSTSVMSGWNGLHGVHVGIVKNGYYLAGAYATDDSKSAEQGSVTVTTNLKVGDEVWVKHQVHDNATVYGGGLTSFMGCLVTPL